MAACPPAVRAVMYVLVLGLLLTVGMGCDQTPGAVTTPNAAPAISDVTFAPTRVVIADLPPDRIGDGVIAINLEIGLTATDPDGTVERVIFTLEPAQDPGSVAQGDLQPVTADRYALAALAELPNEEAQYTVRVFALDDAGTSSNIAISSLRILSDDE